MPQPPKNQSGAGQAGKRDSDDQQAIAVAIQSINSQLKTYHDSNAEHDREVYKWTRRAAKAAIAYTVLTSLLLAASIYTAFQATIATYAASRQAAIAADTEERQLRPYVYITPDNFSAVSNPDGTVVVKGQPTFKVVGQLPAGPVNPMWELRVLPFPMDANFVFAYLKVKSKINAIAPQGVSLNMVEQSVTISKEDITAIEKGTKRIYLDGAILYGDPFNKGRWTNFCYTTNFGLLGNSRGQFETCDTHNQADWNQASPETPIKFDAKM